MINIDKTRKRFDLDQRVGDPFIKRPAFLVGTKFQQLLSPTKPDFPMQKRALDREGRLRRKSFKLTGPVARPTKTIQEIERLKTKQQGIKIRLGPGQFGKVRVAKRDAEGNVIKDEEGQIIYELKEFNLSIATLPLQDRLDILQDALLTGITGKLDGIGLTLATILGSSEDVRDLSGDNLRLLQQVLGAAREPREAGEVRSPIINPWDEDSFSDIPDQRFITKEMWQNNDGDIQTRVYAFILKPGATAFAPQLDAKNPIFGIGAMGGTIKFNAINTEMGKGNVVLDLGRRKIFRNMEKAREGAGERVEIDVRSAATTSAAAAAVDEEDDEKADPTAAAATAVAATISAAQDDPSGRTVTRDLRSAIRTEGSSLQSRSGIAPSSTFEQQTSSSMIQPAAATFDPFEKIPISSEIATLSKKNVETITTADLANLSDDLREELAYHFTQDQSGEIWREIKNGRGIVELRKSQAVSVPVAKKKKKKKKKK